MSVSCYQFHQKHFTSKLLTCFNLSIYLLLYSQRSGPQTKLMFAVVSPDGCALQ